MSYFKQKIYSEYINVPDSGGVNDGGDIGGGIYNGDGGCVDDGGVYVGGGVVGGFVGGVDDVGVGLVGGRERGQGQAWNILSCNTLYCNNK